jgi:hypothetical protein
VRHGWARRGVGSADAGPCRTPTGLRHRREAPCDSLQAHSASSPTAPNRQTAVAKRRVRCVRRRSPRIPRTSHPASRAPHCSARPPRSAGARPSALRHTGASRCRHHRRTCRAQRSTRRRTACELHPRPVVTQSRSRSRSPDALRTLLARPSTPRPSPSICVSSQDG